MGYENEVIVWYDLETSGLYSNRHDIIQIAAIATGRKTLEIIEKFECKLQFNHATSSQKSLERNCYIKEIWDIVAVPQDTAFHLFDKFLRKYRTWKRISNRTGKGYTVTEIGGHNLQFDNDFLIKFYAKNAGSNWTSTSAWRGGWIDTLDIAKTIQVMSGEHWEDGFQLGVLCKKFNVELANAHDALADVKATVELYRKLRETITLSNKTYQQECYFLSSEDKLELAQELAKNTEFINDR